MSVDLSKMWTSAAPWPIAKRMPSVDKPIETYSARREKSRTMRENSAEGIVARALYSQAGRLDWLESFPTSLSSRVLSLSVDGASHKRDHGHDKRVATYVELRRPGKEHAYNQRPL